MTTIPAQTIAAPSPTETDARKACRQDAGAPSSPWRNMFNMLACPTDVLEAVVSAPPKLANWRIPTLLVAATTIIYVQLGPLRPQVQLPFGPPGLDPIPALTDGYWPILSSLTIVLATFGGSLWSAFTLWIIGRVFLRARFSLLKALEIVGLSGAVIVLGTIVTGLLITIFADPSARPALSLLLANASHGSRFHEVLGIFDLFSLWSAILMSLGLSRLAGVLFSEAAFWVFGYWFALRFALVLLA